MTTTPARADGRTHYEAVLDVRFGMRFNELCERFYNRADLLLGLLTPCGGSAALVSFVNQSPPVAAWAGAVLGVTAIFGRLLGAGRKAEQHCVAKRAYAALDAKCQTLSIDDIDSALRPLQAGAPSGIRLLDKPAYNANLLSAGRAECIRPLDRMERMAQLFS